MRNQIEFVVYGKYALFTDPVTRIGGEKFSYQIPTYQALKGIVESIYWKPSINWIIDQVRVINPIQMEVKSMRPMKYQDHKNELAYYTYLRNPKYQVRAHFGFNKNRPDLKHDWNENKHHNIAKRSVERGGRRDIFLGSRECQGYVEACDFESGIGVYKESGDISFGRMFHGFTYPDESGGDDLEARFWIPEMKNGVIDFIPPEECPMVRSVKKYNQKKFEIGVNMNSVDNEHKEIFGEEDI
ncbi:type I-C CRISPR-associated protein Cas5c [Ornithinibacillus sp. 4-3]|uniref:pre-crRNA processing endonuclease n=1 Tax=Ornithinibacillus sp. 4-3 TaxID=3231488 RepID=A0AB39HQ17_9BACI